MTPNNSNSLSPQLIPEIILHISSFIAPNQKEGQGQGVVKVLLTFGSIFEWDREEALRLAYASGHKRIVELLTAGTFHQIANIW